MSLKIIKKGSGIAAHVEAVSFAQELVPAPERDAGLPPWMEGRSGSGPPFVPDKSPAPGSPAANELAQVEKQAYESGFRQGEKAGLEIAEKKMEVLMRRYADALAEIGKVRAALYEKVEMEVVRLAIEVAKKIVHREIKADPEIIQSLVKVALGHAADKSAVTVHLHPVDYNYILERRAELSAGSRGGREIVLLADKSIDRGGCLIQTECGDIDARVEEKFREVEKSFLGDE